MTVSVMLDLETWGTRPGCDIRSIGAVVFDPTQGFVGGFDDFEQIDRQFYIATDNPFAADKYYTNAAFEHRKHPLHRDPKTVKWWNDQSPEAQAAFENPVDLRVALASFSDWLFTVTFPQFDTLTFVDAMPVWERTDIRIWANDPHFDVSILAEAYHAVGLPVPWHYRAPRSMKTATDLAGLTRDEYVTHGTAHNALDDAIAQAWTICKCYEKLGLVE